MQVSGLGASYGPRVILAEVDFALPAQGVTALLGPVAAGKSTLIRTLAGLNANNPRFCCWGQIDYAGKPVHSSPPSAAVEADLPRLVQQNSKLMLATVLDALLEVVRPTKQRTTMQWREWATAKLQDYGFPDLVLALDEPATRLSLVQQRVINILRQAWAKPALLMIDEPTANLKGYEAYLLLDLIKQVAQESAVLLATHQKKHARAVAQQMLLLAGGRIQEAGAMEQFLLSPASAAGQQFVRTGSCAVPMPGTPLHELADDVLPPPPLPQAALRAMAEFRPEGEVQTLPNNERDIAVNQAPQKREPETVESVAVQTAIRPPEATTVTAQVTAAQMPGVAAVSRPIKAAALMELTPLLADAAAIPASQGPAGFAWLVPGRLAGMCWPQQAPDMEDDFKALKRCGVTMLISLTKKDFEPGVLARNGLKNFHLPVYDKEPPSVAQMQMLLVRMSVAMQRGEVLAVHCHQGMGCTGNVLAAWLVRDGLSADEALARLRSLNVDFVQSLAQQAFLHEYEVTLRHRGA